jgi:hypothetical protein
MTPRSLLPPPDSWAPLRMESRGQARDRRRGVRRCALRGMYDTGHTEPAAGSSLCDACVALLAAIAQNAAARPAAARPSA